MIPRLHRFGDNTAAITLLSLIMMGHLFIVWIIGRDSGLHIYFTLAGAMLFMFGPTSAMKNGATPKRPAC
jgi:adenylate cyclase